MSYVDGFVAAVPTENKEAYLAHAKKAWEILKNLGATAMWECWGDDVPDGEVTSFPMAVQAKDNETILFSWTLWPDKPARDAGWAQLMSDPEIAAVLGDMPFDGKRMIFGGFTPMPVMDEDRPG